MQTKYQIQWKYDNGFDSWKPASTWATKEQAENEYAHVKRSWIMNDDAYWRLVEIIERVIG